MKVKDRPFAIEFLEPLREKEAQKVNGGRHHGGLTGILTHPTPTNPHNDFRN